MNSRQLCATMFPLVGLTDQQFRVRVLRVLDNIPNDDLRPIRMQRWADILWHDLKVPVFPSYKMGSPAFVVPSTANLAAGVVVNIHDTPDADFRVQITDQVVDIDLARADAAERMLAAKMIERSITDRFGELKRKYWRTQWNLFFRHEAANADATGDEVNAYRGLHFGVIFLDGTKPHLVGDIKTRFFGRYPLAQCPIERRVELLEDHVDPELKVEERALFIRDNITLKRSCRYVDTTGKTVSEFRLTDLSNISVWEYYRDNYKDITLDPNDEAVLVRDHGSDRSLAVPASRLFPIYTTDDDEMHRCSVTAQLSPTERVNLIMGFLADLGAMRFAGREFSVGKELLYRDRSVFSAPALEFGKGNRLTIADKDIATADEDETFMRWRDAKVSSLYKFGPYSSQPLPDCCLLFPETLSRAHRETLVARLTEEVKRLTGHNLNLVKQRAYRLGGHARSGVGLIAEAETLTREQRGVVLVLVVLSSRFDGHVYGMLKSCLNGLPSQCIAERTVQRIATERESGFAASRLRNLGLGVLTAAGVQPWVLGEALNYDFYVGIDVAQNEIGYTFVYGQCGRRVRMEFGEFLPRVKQHEAIGRVELRNRLENALRGAHKAGAPLRSIIVHRDGRWWPSEEQGLQEAIAALKREEVLASDCRVGVVEIRKSHLPIRLLGKALGHADWQNPMPGSFLKLDESQVVLTTTGKPGVWDRQKRTAGTLLVRLAREVEGLDITRLAEDVYRLTHLNWNAPEIEISLPVTIRWNDDWLRYAVLRPEDDAEPSEAQEVSIGEEAGK